MENRSFIQNPNFNLNSPSDGNKPPQPNNNLVLAIIATVLGLCSPCCIGLILGIIAIVFSNQVDTKYNYGDYFGAESAAKNTKILSLVAIGLFALNLIWGLVQLSTVGYDGLLLQYENLIQELSKQ